MDRIGGEQPFSIDWEDNHTASYDACKGAPATIQPGAVVKMAKALEVMLEDYRDASDEWDDENRDYAESVIAKARSALAAYYGENQ